MAKMAKVKIEEIVDHLSVDMRHALSAAVREVIADAEFNERALFHAFRRAVGRRCATWALVPDRYVRE